MGLVERVANVWYSSMCLNVDVSVLRCPDIILSIVLDSMIEFVAGIVSVYHRNWPELVRTGCKFFNCRVGWHVWIIVIWRYDILCSIKDENFGLCLFCLFANSCCTASILCSNCVYGTSFVFNILSNNMFSKHAIHIDMIYCYLISLGLAHDFTFRILIDFRGLYVLYDYMLIQTRKTTTSCYTLHNHVVVTACWMCKCK